MRIAHLFLLFALLLLGIGITIMVITYEKYPTLFYLSEGGTVLLECGLAVLYHYTVRPLHAIEGGIRLMRQHDNMSRLHSTGGPDTDELVEMFNAMLSQQVVSAEKTAYEKVIRMIAHEVNNSVAAITPQLDEQDEAVRQRLMSLSQFVSRFASVAKVPHPSLWLEDLNEVVESCRPLLENLCREQGVKLDIQTTDEASPVRMDSVLFQQVLVNIVKNAMESCCTRAHELKDSDYQGTVSIEVKGTTLTVTDNGTGIRHEVATRLFSPFFSTKPAGQGIGLMLVNEILKHHNCHFSLATDEDGLTHFVISF